jgi:hypothetical protein
VDYDSASISSFIREIPKRIDGWGLIIAAVALSCIALLDLVAPSLAKVLGEKKILAAPWLIPFAFVLYGFIVYFSGSGRMSKLTNFSLLVALPILLIMK